MPRFLAAGGWIASMLLLLSLLHAGTTLRYSGGLLGVSADVVLVTDESRAAIRLRGVPIGGVIEGGATFDSEHQVVLDEALTMRLRRLRVRVLSVTPSDDLDFVYVRIRLPLFLGTHTISLAKASGLGDECLDGGA